MFQNTHPKLLGVLHSLLSKPFDFGASECTRNRFSTLLGGRADYEALCQLSDLYDRQREQLRPKLGALRAALESEYSILLGADADVAAVMTPVERAGAPAGTARALATATLQIQLERISDAFGLLLCGRGCSLESEEVKAALSLMMLNEALALALAGIAAVRTVPDGFILAPSDDVSRRTLLQTWFARWADGSSQKATPMIAAKLRIASGFAEVDVLVARLMDQSVTINIARLGPQAKALKSVVDVHQAARLAAVLMLYHVGGDQWVSKDVLTERHDLGETANDILIYQRSALRTDWLLEASSSGVRLCTEGTKALRCFFAKRGFQHDEVEALRKHVGGIGFETRYIRERLEEDAIQPGRYSVHEGFRAEDFPSATVAKCDIEFVLYDAALDHHYFIQIKHAARGEIGHMHSVVKSLQKDLHKGLEQLRGAKHLLEQGVLGPFLAARGLGAVSLQNSSFLLVHNIAQFDFQRTDDGLAMYEWASLRNLLDDATSVPVQIEVWHEPCSLPHHLLLSDPRVVVDQLVTHHPSYSAHGSMFAAAEVEQCYEVMGAKVTVSGLGI